MESFCEGFLKQELHPGVWVTELELTDKICVLGLDCVYFRSIKYASTAETGPYVEC
jgi:hypothetical protein